MAPSPWLAVLLFSAGSVLGVACTGPLPGDESDDSNSEPMDCPIGSLNCPCTAGNTCDPGLVCAAKVCTAAAETSEGSSEGSSGDEPTTTGTSNIETTSPAECDPGGGGAVDPSCAADEPYCLAGECVACGAIDCAAVSADTPMCDPDTGLCAACLCDDANPVCDPEAHTCSKCTDHAQCPGSACDLWSGACFPLSGALWVDAVDCSDNGAGTADDPLCTLTEAFARIGADPQVGHAVRVRAADYDVAAPLEVPENGKVAVIEADGGDGVVTITAPNSAAIDVADGGRLLIDAIALADSGADALLCTGGQLWLDRFTVAMSAGHGMVTEGCDLMVRRSVITGNYLSGASVSDGTLHVENTYITGNGNTTDGSGGVFLSGGASLDAVYTSFVSNVSAVGSPRSVGCNINPEDPADETVMVRNSVAINKGTSTLCEGAEVTRTGWSTADDPGAGNLAILDAELSMYLTMDPQVGVYRAIAGTMLDELAVWEDGDPAIDFDGDPRPNGDNAPDFAGADRVRP